MYPNHEELVVEVDYEWIRPLPAGEPIRVLLSQPTHHGAIVIDRHAPLEHSLHHNWVEATLPLTDLSDGQYIAAAKIAKHELSVQFHLPISTPKLPSPCEYVVPRLPAPIRPPDFDLTVAPGGGVTVSIHEKTFVIESTFSYPHGGNNGLLVRPNPDTIAATVTELCPSQKIR